MKVYIYLVMAVWISLLGVLVHLGRKYHWESTVLIGKRKYVVSLNVIPWFLIFTTMTLFGGLRYRVGTDFESYAEIFGNISRQWFDPRYAGTEWAFVWLNRLITVFTVNPQYLFFITNLFITSFGLICIGKYSRFVPLSLYIFYTTIYYQGFNLVRQGMACAVVFLAFGVYHEGKWIKSYLLILLASLFHRTALIALPVFVLMQFRYSQVWYYIFGVLASLAFLLKEQINDLLLRFYPSAAATDASYLYEEFSPVQVILSLSYVILCFLYYRKMLTKKPHNVVYINFSVLLLGLYTCFYWIPMWGRLQLYFSCFYGLIVPELISCEDNRVLRVIYYLAIWGIMLFFYMVPVWISGTGFWEYQMIP